MARWQDGPVRGMPGAARRVNVEIPRRSVAGDAVYYLPAASRRMPLVTIPTLVTPAAQAASMTARRSRRTAPCRRRSRTGSCPCARRRCPGSCFADLSMRRLLLVDREVTVGHVLGHDLTDVVGLLVPPSSRAGRLMSTPFWVSGRAAMKMTSSTSRTSMSGVTFMSALTCAALAVINPAP